MILPSRHLSRNRALLTVGGAIIKCLAQPVTVSALWEEMRRSTDKQKDLPYLRYDAFVLALDMLFLIGAIELKKGLLNLRSS
ncbi:MAG: ABC-three component system middle component 6 [Pseudomonadota bacterium]